MAFRDVRIGGVLMGTHNRGVDLLDGRRFISQRQFATLPTPGQHGTDVVMGPFSVAPLVMSIWMDGTGSDGSASNWSENLESALAETLALLHPPSGVVVVTVEDGDGNTRSADCRVVGTSPVREDVRTGLPLARLTVTMDVLEGMWLAPASFTVESTTGPLPRLLDLLPGHEGGGAPVRKASIKITGPIVNPKITSGTQWFQYNGTLTTGQELLVDLEAMTATIDGVSVLQHITYTPGVGGLIDILPPYQATLSGTSSGTPKALVSGRRAYF